MTAEAASRAPAGEAGFRLLAEHLPDLVLLAFDPELQIWAATGAALRARGWTRGHFVGKRVPEVGRPADAAITEAYCRDALRGECRRLVTTGKTDRTRVWTFLFVPLPDERGAVIGGMVIARDVTDQRRAERQLLASRRQLAQAQRIAQVGSWEWELDSGETSMSDELARILGVPPGSRLRMRDIVADYVHPTDLDRVLARMGRLPSDPSPYTLGHRIVRGDGPSGRSWSRARAWSTRTGGWCGSSAPTRTSPTAAGPRPSAAASSAASTRPRRARTAGWPPTCTTATSRAWPRSASSWSRPGCAWGPAAPPRSTSCCGRSPRTCRPR